MVNDSVVQLWKQFKKEYPDAPEHYEAWAFGDSKEMADELATLVLEGTKTATASKYTMYEEHEPLPYVGLYNVLLDGSGQAVAVIKTTSVEVMPFDEVSEEQAFLEGEGDRSLNYWRKVHQEFFEKELREIKQDFHDKIPVVCEKFEVIFK